MPTDTLMSSTSTVLVHARVELPVLGELRRRVGMMQQRFPLALVRAYPRHLPVSVAHFRLHAIQNAPVDRDLWIFQMSLCKRFLISFWWPFMASGDDNLTCCKCCSPSSAFNIDCAISVCSSLIFCIISLISYRNIPRKHNFKNAITQYPNTKRMSAVCLIHAIRTSVQPWWDRKGEEGREKKLVRPRKAISKFNSAHCWYRCRLIELGIMLCMPQRQEKSFLRPIFYAEEADTERQGAAEINNFLLCCLILHPSRPPKSRWPFSARRALLEHKNFLVKFNFALLMLCPGLLAFDKLWHRQWMAPARRLLVNNKVSSASVVGGAGLSATHCKKRFINLRDYQNGLRPLESHSQPTPAARWESRGRQRKRKVLEPKIGSSLSSPKSALRLSPKAVNSLSCSSCLHIASGWLGYTTQAGLVFSINFPTAEPDWLMMAINSHLRVDGTTRRNYFAFTIQNSTTRTTPSVLRYHMTPHFGDVAYVSLVFS